MPDVDGLRFDFPPGWHVHKFDDWAYYRKQFITLKDGLKAVDIVAIAPNHTLYLVEVKDYLGRTRHKRGAIEAEFVDKVVATLAALIPASCVARDNSERGGAGQFCSARDLRLVLHLEQGKPGNRLFPPVEDAANLLQALKRRFHASYIRPMISSMAVPASVPWKVTRV